MAVKKEIQSLILFFAIVTSYTCLAQNRLLDSLKKQLVNTQDTTRLKLLEELAWNAADYDPLLSKLYAKQELALAKSLNNTEYQGLSYNNLAYYYYVANALDSAVLLQKQVLEIGKSLNSEGTIASSYNNLGTYYWKIDDLELAMDYFIRALRIYEKLKRKSGTARVLNNVAGVFVDQKKYSHALPYYSKALQVNSDIGDSLEINSNLLNMGIAHEEMHQYDSALLYYNQSLLICDKTSDRTTKAIVWASLGNINRKTGKYSTALDYYTKSYALHEELGIANRLVENLTDMGKTYTLMNDYKNAEQSLKAALQKSKAVNLKSYTRKVYSGLASLYEALADYKQAYQYHKLLGLVNDSLFNEESAKKIMELNIKYQTEKKEQQIAFQQSEIHVLNQTANVERLRKSLLGGSLLATILIGALSIYSVREKLKRQKTERAREKETYEKDLAFKKKELAIHTLHLVRKSELLENIHSKLEELRKEPEANKNAIRKLVQLIKHDYQTEKDWQNFKSYFEQVHEHFDAKLREHFNDLTHHEIRLATLLKMNLSTKEIASILNISPDSVNKARYRLRKKLNLSSQDSLENFLLAL